MKTPQYRVQHLEKVLLAEWQMLLDGVANNDPEIILTAKSDLASTMAYLLNVFLEHDTATNWREMGADDLLYGGYDFLSADKMSAYGLMCWGDQDHITYLSPFLGEFQRQQNEVFLRDFTLYFKPNSPDDDFLKIPITKGEKEKRQSQGRQPYLIEAWGKIYRRDQIQWNRNV